MSIQGRRLNDLLGLSLNDRNILFLVNLLDKSDKAVFALGRSPKEGFRLRPRPEISSDYLACVLFLGLLVGRGCCRVTLATRRGRLSPQFKLESRLAHPAFRSAIPWSGEAGDGEG